MLRGRTIVLAACVAAAAGCATQATPGKGSPTRADAGTQGSRIDASSATVIDGGAGGGCGTVTEGGACAGDVLTFCEMAMVVTINCADEGAAPCHCEMDYCDCTDTGATGLDGGTGGGTCGTLTDDGLCMGTTVKWCEGGTVQQFDCAEIGSTCACVMGYCDCS